MVDKNLRWQHYLDYLRKKISSALYILRRLRTITNEQTAIVLFHYLFASYLLYGVVAWGAASMNNIQRVLTLQKKAGKLLEQSSD
jgi:hypothetical protein